MGIIWLYSLASVCVVSIVSLIGVTALSMATNQLRKMLFVLVAFAAGALLGDVFFHIFPEMIKDMGFEMRTSLNILAGILSFFVLEKFIHWHHCHLPETKEHRHSFAIVNLFGDALHNFFDGVIIAVSYMVSIPVGIATTVAVLFHEIPQEIGDFAVLLQGGFSKKKAVLYNFLTALTAVLGSVFALVLRDKVDGAEQFFVPFTVGSFLYIAGSDLIPELHKEQSAKKSLFQLVALVAGIAVMSAFLFLE